MTVDSVTPATFTLHRLDTDHGDGHDPAPGPGRADATSYRRTACRYPVPALVDDAKGDRGLPRTALTLPTGTGADGHWTAEVPVGAVNRGSHELSVEMCPSSTDCNASGPVTVSLGEGIDVDGTDWPELVGIAQDPKRLAAGETRGAEVTGSVVFSASDDPAPGCRHRTGAGARGATRAWSTPPASRGGFRSPWPWPTRPRGSARRHDCHQRGATVLHDQVRLGVPATTFEVRMRGSPRPSSDAGRRWQVSGTVTPGVATTRLGPVLLQRRTDRGWRTVTRTALEPLVRDGKPTRTGTFTLAHRFDTNGRLTLRVHKPGAACGPSRCQVASGSSDRIVVVVGSPTYLVERHLAALGVPVGDVDGTTDARTRQALCAWRDISGRTPSREGLTPSLARSILSASRLPRPDRSDGLYVNKTCQVLFQVVDQRYRRIVWVSTGSPGYDTPVGTGAVFRKLEGPVESTLYPEAYMYDPMFFLTSRPGDRPPRFGEQLARAALPGQPRLHPGVAAGDAPHLRRDRDRHQGHGLREVLSARFSAP